MFLNCFSMMYPVMIFAIHYNLSFSVAHIDVHTKLNSPLYINILYIHIYIWLGFSLFTAACMLYSLFPILPLYVFVFT